MGLGDCCGQTTRCILVMINIPIFLAGCCLLIAGGVFMANKQFDFYPELEEFSENIDDILIPIMVLGAVFLLIGMLGCVGGCTEKDWLLKPYFGLVLIIVIAQIALIIAGVIKKDAVKSKSEEIAEDLFGRYKAKFVVKDGSTEITTNEILSVNTFQNVVGCCGLVDGASWWKTADVTKFPPGCCKEWVATNPANLVDSCDSVDDLYTEGCTEKVSALLNEFGAVIAGVLGAIIVFQVLCMAAACYIWKRENATNESA